MAHTITVAGLDVTASALIGRVEFISRANGQSGTCRVEISDTVDTASFRIGSVITLDIDGVRQWTGWLMTLRRAYHATVWPTRGLCEGLVVTPRVFVLEGVDLNVLFTKRVVWDHDDPSHELPGYPATTSDRAVLLDLVQYLDLDGLVDATTKVDAVGVIGVFNEIDPTPFAEGQMWGQAVQTVAAVTGAVFYIDPDGFFVYADVDGLSSTTVFTDAPVESVDVGVREIEILHDGAKLVNDMFEWGTALGVDHYVFKRVQDAPSITTHGRWQAGDTSTLYHQKYVDARANSFVYGTPQSKRGGKDDRMSVRFAVFNTPVRCGERYTFRSMVFRYEDVLPVREVRVTLPTKTDIRLDVILSHEIDPPWQFFETRWPPVPGRKPPPDPPGVPVDPGTGLISGVIIDSFSRVILPIYGDTDDGGYDAVVPGGLGSGELTHWAANAFGDTTYHSVENGRGVMRSRRTYRFEQFNFFGDPQSQGTSVPGATPSGQLVNFNNILVKFRLGRDRRVYPSTVTATQSQPAGIPPWDNIPGIGDRDIYGRPNPATASFVSPGLIGVNGVSLEFGAITEFLSGELGGGDPGSGEWWTVCSAPDDSGGWHGDLGGGVEASFADGVYGKAGFHPIWSHYQAMRALQFGGHTVIREFYFVGPDLPGMSYPWRVNAGFALPQMNVGFVRNNLPTFDGEAYAIAFTPRSSIFGGFVSSTTAAMVLQPDTDYWLRCYTPPGTNEASLSIWPAGGGEPGVALLTVTAWNSDGTARNNFFSRTLDANTGSSLSTYITPYDYEAHTLEIDMIAAAPVGAGLGSVIPTAGAVLCEQASWVDDPSSPVGTEHHVFRVNYAWDRIVSVSVDGIELQPTLWYEDPALGSGYVYIIPAVSGSDTVRVCYLPIVFTEPGGTTGGTSTPPPGSPDLTGPVYRPAFVSQFGWHTDLDGSNCTMASGCMALDRHTLGAKTSNPPLMRTYQDDQVGGTDLGDLDTAWHRGYGEDLDVVTTSWAGFLSRLNSGRGAVLQGIYAQLGSYRFQTSFTGGHAMYINEQRGNGDLLVFDPIGHATQWIPESVVRAYAEAFGGGSAVAGFTRVAV